MNYTAEELRQIADAIDAEKQGRIIQYKWTKSNNPWTDCPTPMMGFSENIPDGRRLYRPKPEPVTRPWNESDVPVVCALRKKQRPCRVSSQFAIISMDDEGVSIFSEPSRGGDEDNLSWEELARDWEYSTDRKNWKPCTVTEP